MISREQLKRIAVDTGLNLYQQEKDYLLKLFIYLYYKSYQSAVFKGGTYLKYALNLDRFSEDLDFNISNPVKFKKQVKRTLLNLRNTGIINYFIKEELFKSSYTCEIGFEGPLYNGNIQTRNKFRIDAGYRIGTLKNPEWKLIKSEYPETGHNFLVYALSLEEILIEKIIALFQRRKGRDLYDVWFMINAGVKFNKKIFNKKSKGKLNIENIPTKQDYTRDISKLTNKMLPYNQLKKDILLFIKKSKIIDRKWPSKG